MSSQGYIYVLINPAMPGLLKIGLTTKTPEERVKELSSATGVPVNFILIYKEFFQDCVSAEKAIHTRLEAQGFRFNKGREFFEAEPADVVDVIKDIKAIEKELLRDDVDRSETEDSVQQPWEYYQDLADNYYYGLGDKLQDYTEAYKNYLKAFELNSPTAPKMLGDMNRLGDGVKVNNGESLKYYKAGVERGDNDCWFDIAMYFSVTEQHKDNFIKAFQKYILQANNDNISIYTENIILLLRSTTLLYDLNILFKDDVIMLVQLVAYYKASIIEYYQKINDFNIKPELIEFAEIFFDLNDNLTGISLLQIYFNDLIKSNQIDKDNLMFNSLGLVADTMLIVIKLYEENKIDKDNLMFFTELLNNDRKKFITYCNYSISIAEKSIVTVENSNLILSEHGINNNNTKELIESNNDVILNSKEQIISLIKIRKFLSDFMYGNDTSDMGYKDDEVMSILPSYKRQTPRFVYILYVTLVFIVLWVISKII